MFRIFVAVVCLRTHHRTGLTAIHLQ